MKAIKTLCAVSALVTVAGAANATVWNITAYANTYISAGGSSLIMDLSGIYDDSATKFNGTLGRNITGVATMSGNAYIPDFSTSIHYNTIEFDMGADGYGAAVRPDESFPNCTDNTGSGCAGFSQAFAFPLYNAINFAQTTSKSGTFDSSTANPFTVASGIYTWTGVVNIPVNGKNTLARVPFTIIFPAPIPIPSAAWLFGSGLIGFAGTARRRRRA